jgi:hypothetical protein
VHIRPISNALGGAKTVVVQGAGVVVSEVLRCVSWFEEGNGSSGGEEKVAVIV